MELWYTDTSLYQRQVFLHHKVHDLQIWWEFSHKAYHRHMSGCLKISIINMELSRRYWSQDCYKKWKEKFDLNIFLHIRYPRILGLRLILIHTGHSRKLTKQVGETRTESNMVLKRRNHIFLKFTSTTKTRSLMLY